MGILRYVSHPQVEIDPDVPVPKWSLSAEGRDRAVAGSAQPWAQGITRLVTSQETKAIETAEILAAACGAPVEIRPDTGEIDRSATGYVSHERHEALADELFAAPTRSASGWERAVDASSRIVAAVADLIQPGRPGHVVIVGHGGVGTLLMCHLADLDIARLHDQPHGGCHWAFDNVTGSLVHPWRPI